MTSSQRRTILRGTSTCMLGRNVSLYAGLFPLVSRNLGIFCIFSILFVISPSFCGAVTSASDDDNLAQQSKELVHVKSTDHNLEEIGHHSSKIQQHDENQQLSQYPPNHKLESPVKLVTQRQARGTSGIKSTSKSQKLNPESYNRLSRALERIHFGPFLRIRAMSSRVTLPRKFDSFEFPNPREKKALSFFSRFYPILQYGGSDGSDLMMDGYNSRRRVSFPHSGEFPSGRSSSRLMRLRWGK